MLRTILQFIHEEKVTMKLMFTNTYKFYDLAIKIQLTLHRAYFDFLVTFFLLAITSESIHTSTATQVRCKITAHNYVYITIVNLTSNNLQINIK